MARCLRIEFLIEWREPPTNPDLVLVCLLRRDVLSTLSLRESLAPTPVMAAVSSDHTVPAIVKFPPEVIGIERKLP